MAQTIAGIWKRYSGFVPGAEGIPALTEAQRAVVIGTFASATMNVGHAVRIMDLTSADKSWQRAVAAEAGVSESRIRQHAGFWSLLDAAGLGADVDTDLYLAAQRWYFAGDSKSRNALAAEIGTMGDRDAARVRFFTEATTAHVTKQAAKKQKQGARPEGHKGGKQEQEQEGTRLTKEQQEQATVKVKHPLAQFAAHLADAADALKGYTPSEAEQERIVEELAKFTDAIHAMIGTDVKVEVAA
jgi:hypothetical protein